ncbi:MAG: type VI secretion system baseplate subunit TssK [Deltaproteobacteria bacterium]|nr:type VI secretion system baseplate subunit TssK [Deltaproteobacteria bacterium]
MSANSYYRPLWKEGMFLAPQHMQQSENYRDAVESVLVKAVPPYPWGISKIDIDTHQFTNSHFSLNELQAITGSYEVVQYPGNIEIPSRSFERLFTEPNQKLGIYLGIPDYEKNSANLLGDRIDLADERVRYRALETSIFDENTGEMERAVEVRMIRGRLFFEGEDTAGYSLLPIARLRPAPNMEGAILDEKYVPPILALSACPPLQKSLQGVTAKLVALQSNLMRSMGSKSVVEWCGDPRGAELMFKIQAANQAFFVLNQISGTNSISPFDAYTELLRAVGLLWAFKGTENIAKVPFYDHSKLDNCFGTIVDVLRKLISIADVQSYVSRKFSAVQGRMEVDMESSWLKRKLYIRVSGAGEYGDVINKLTGLKLCAPSHFNQVLQRRIQALQVHWLRTPPPSLPAVPGCVYAEIAMGGPFWPGVEKELALAVGASNPLPFQFELYVE